MSEEMHSRVRYGEAFWRAHHEAWRRSELRVLRGSGDSAEGIRQLAGEVQSGASAIRDLNSLFLVIHSLIGVRKFPVPLRREFRCKRLNSLADWTRKSQRRSGIDEIPC